jgi:hypothetical protein
MFDGDLIQGVDKIQEIILDQTKEIVDKVHLELRMLYAIYIVQVCMLICVLCEDVPICGSVTCMCMCMCMCTCMRMNINMMNVFTLYTHTYIMHDFTYCQAFYTTAQYANKISTHTMIRYDHQDRVHIHTYVCVCVCVYMNYA